jgi:integrase
MIDFRFIGAHMSRDRYSEGSLKKVGKRLRQWQGRWQVYVMVAGVERRRERVKILGPATMSRSEAKERLRELIRKTRGDACPLPVKPRFRDLWNRYVTLKTNSDWQEATRAAITSVFHRHVLPLIGDYDVKALTLDPLMDTLGTLARERHSRSVVQKARTYIKAVLEYATDEGIIDKNPARGKKLKLPRGLRKERNDYLSLDQVQRLLSVARGREHLIARLFIVCGLRPGELFALRLDDPEPGQLRIDEAIKQAQKGDERMGDPKTEASDDCVFVPPSIEEELRMWLSCRGSDKREFIFPSRKGTAFWPNNYLKRILRPLAKTVGIRQIDYQMLRRTFTTHFQRHGSPKDAQAQLRHANLKMTSRYMQAIPESVKRAVEALDAEVTAIQ